MDQAKKGYKKTVGMSKKKVTKEEDESTEKLLSVCVGKRLQLKTEVYGIL